MVYFLCLDLINKQPNIDAVHVQQNASERQDPLSARLANTSILSGQIMKQIGILVLLDVPDELTPHEVARIMPRVIDSGFEIFDEPDREGTSGWEQRRMFVLSDQHRKAFEQCLIQEVSS